MSLKITKLMTFAVIIAVTSSLLVGVNAVIEQVVKAQNMTTNMTAGNSTDDESGSISGKNRMAPPGDRTAR